MFWEDATFPIEAVDNIGCNLLPELRGFPAPRTGLEHFRRESHPARHLKQRTQMLLPFHVQRHWWKPKRHRKRLMASRTVWRNTSDKWNNGLSSLRDLRIPLRVHLDGRGPSCTQGTRCDECRYCGALASLSSFFFCASISFTVPSLPTLTGG